MLTVVILAWLGLAVYIGYRRGLFHESIYLLGYSFSFIIATLNCHTFGKWLMMIVPYPYASINQKMVYFSGDAVYHLDQFYYAGVAFLMLFLIGWLGTRFIGTLMYRLSQTFRKFPVWRLMNKCLGAVVCFLTTAVFITAVLLVLTSIPNDMVQQLLAKSSVAKMMLEMPGIPDYLSQLWMN